MAQANIIQVYNPKRERVAFLQNAYNIGFKKSLNSLWFANFSLPADDLKNQYCKPFNYVEIYDGDKRVDLFRIISADLTRGVQGEVVYSCEHVLATLMDDVLFGYHQIGNLGVNTTQVLRYILDRQTVQSGMSAANWRLGTVDFAHFYEYKGENENLLSMLLSIPKPFTASYIWTWDTTSLPWVINLKRLETSGEPKSEIRYGKNMTEIKKTLDATNVVTRLYALGYGEGVNQLNISNVNSGLPYIDAPTKATWGLKSSILVDRRFEDAESLKAYAQQLLNSAKDPYVSYSASAVDLYRLTQQRYDKFEVGDIVRVIDKMDGIAENFPIVEIEKGDITGNPGAINVTIANKSKDLAGSITDLQNRALIGDLYSQGATNQVLISFSDNADINNPALMKLYVPDTMVRVNSCVLNFEFEPFRAYEKGIASAVQNVYTTSSTNTTVNTSSYDSGSYQSTSTDQSKLTTTSTQAASYATTSSGGGSTTTSASTSLELTNLYPDDYNQSKAHNHGIQQGTWLMVSNGNWKADSTGKVSGGATVAWMPSGAHTHGPHTHQVTIQAHTHQVTIPAHSHSLTIPSHNHSVQIPGHSHTISIPGHAHSVTIPAHTHEMTYGIYKTGGVSAGRLYVNGKLIGNVNPNTNINLASYLTDNKGKISRNTFHRIEIYPVAQTGNTQGLTRIVANVFLQIFTNSRGSGDF